MVSGGGEVFLDHAVDDLDARPSAYRQGSRLVGATDAPSRPPRPPRLPGVTARAAWSAMKVVG
jgi:hypothetical protein